ncbi:MAG: glycosyltransferase [Candidatus Rokubacteria bacterium]|nr:glycosyltransferase [Candidatus Rokubacteria bacterium]
MARPPLSSRPVISTLTCTYRRPQLLRVTLDSLRRQTYRDLEIIVVNNGNPPDSETVRYLAAVRAEDPRVRVIDYAENHYSPDDPQRMLTLLDAAMCEVATGELVFVLDDDNFVDEDYFEKMVALFMENPDCTSASGLPVLTDEQGRLAPGAEAEALAHNRRPRFTPGHELALDYFLSDWPTLWRASCLSFVLRRDEYIAGGGIQRGEHYASLFGVVAFGVNGFDPTARLYNRVHGHQLNRSLVSIGNTGDHYVLKALAAMDVERRWREQWGESVARRLATGVRRRLLNKALREVAHLRRHGRLDEALRRCEDTLAVEPDAMEAHRAMGDLYVVCGRAEDALASYRRAIALQGPSADLHARLAAVYHQQGRLTDAVQSLERAVAEDPGASAYHRRLLRLRLRQGRIADAVQAGLAAAATSLETAACTTLFRHARGRRWAHSAGSLAWRGVGKLRALTGGGA